MICFIRISFQTNHGIAKTFPMCKLSECHAQKLLPTGEFFHLIVTLVTGNNGLKLFMRNEAYQLGENIFALIHSSEYQRVNKNQSFKKSNRFHNQIRANSIQTIISKNLINQHQNASETFKPLNSSTSQPLNQNPLLRTGKLPVADRFFISSLHLKDETHSSFRRGQIGYGFN